MRPTSRPIVDRKVRFALVGCGRIAKSHIEAISTHAGSAELVDVCDIDAAALEEAARATGARPHRSIGQLLTETTADAVILTTPSGLHAGQAIKVAEAGFDVVSEKPMATRYDDGLAMVKACDSAGVRLFV